MAQQNIRLHKAWRLVSALFMFASAYSVWRWLAAVGTISGWIGLPQHKTEIPRIQVQAGVWETLALALPFLAAFFLWTGRRNRNEGVSMISDGAACIGISIAGTLGFLLGLFLLGMLLYRSGS
jgi:hypothetical protein